jgi:membrane protease YdiL (CAAX protease family)
MDAEIVQENEIKEPDVPVTDINDNQPHATDLRAARKVFSRVGFAFFMLAFMSVVMQTVVYQFVEWAFPNWSGSSLANYALMLLPMYLIAAPICIFLLRKLEPRPIEQKPLTFGSFLVVLLMCLPIMYTGNLLGTFITSLIVDNSGSTSTDSITTVILGSDILANFIFIGLLAPIIEELLFRKFLIDRIAKYGEGLAVFTSALMFGLFHGNFTQFFYAFGLGLMFAYVYCRTGKLRYSIALHMIINTLGSVLAPFILSKVDLDALIKISRMEADDPKIMQSIEDVLPGLLIIMLYLGVLLILAIIGLVFLIVRRKRFVLEKAELPLPKGKRFLTVWINVGMILFVVVCCGLFALILL